METLQNTYRKNGYEFTLVSRMGDVCIYKQNEPENYYEVFEVPVEKQAERYGKLIPAHERPPSNEEFGGRAFVCYGILAANKKAGYLLGKIDRRKISIRMGDLKGFTKTMIA